MKKAIREAVIFWMTALTLGGALMSGVGTFAWVFIVKPQFTAAVKQVVKEEIRYIDIAVKRGISLEVRTDAFDEWMEQVKEEREAREEQ